MIEEICFSFMQENIKKVHFKKELLNNNNNNNNGKDAVRQRGFIFSFAGSLFRGSTADPLDGAALAHYSLHPGRRPFDRRVLAGDEIGKRRVVADGNASLHCHFPFAPVLRRLYL
jgi:hypothetical protein